MLNSSTSIWLGITFVLVGAINVWLILQSSARVRDTKASDRLIAAHRIGGYLFIALFCVMGYFMLARLADVGGAPPGIGRRIVRVQDSFKPLRPHRALLGSARALGAVAEAGERDLPRRSQGGQ